MKKKFLLAALSILGFTSVSFAQVSFGPKVGLGLSRFVDVKTPSDEPDIDYSYVVVPQVGVVLNAQFGDHFALRPELLYTQRATLSEASATIFGATYRYKGRMRVSYLELPVNLVGSVNAGSGKVELFAGPSFGYVLGGRSKEDVDGPGVNETREGRVIGKKEPADYNSSTDEDTYINPFHVSLNLGAGYKFNNGLLIQLGFNLGLSNLVPHSEDSDTESNRNDTVIKSNAFTLGIAYLFGGK